MSQTKLIDDRRDFGGQQRGKMDREIQKIFMPVQLELMKVNTQHAIPNESLPCVFRI